MAEDTHKVLVIYQGKSDSLRTLLDVDLGCMNLYDLLPVIPEEIAKYECIVLCGGEALVAAGFIEAASTLKTKPVTYQNLPVVPTVSPMAVLHDKTAWATLSKDLHRAFVMVFGAPEIDPNFTKSVLCTDAAQIRQLHQVAKHSGRLAVDIESTGLDRIKDKITVVSLSAQPGYSLVVPVEHFEALASQGMMQAMSELFYDHTVEKVLQNAKFDLVFFYRYGFVFKGIIHDTLCMHHQLHNNKDHGLKDMVREYFPRIAGYEAALDKYNKQYDSIPLSDLVPYAGMDADATLRLSYILEDALVTRDPKEYNCYRNIMSAALKPLFMAEYKGCRIDKALLASAIVEAKAMKESLAFKIQSYPEVQLFLGKARQAVIDKRVLECRAKIESSKTPKAKQGWSDKLADAMAGNVDAPVFNPDSPIQLKQLLFWKGYGFEFIPPVLEGERGGTESTDKNVLNEIDDPSGFIDLVLTYRGISKTLSTYLLSILEKTDDNGYLHGRFNLSGTKTYRMSSSEPNLQNVISRSKFEEVMNIVSYVKKSFKPEEGEVLLSCDYSQAELRFISHVAKEANMITAYNSDKDLHIVGACNSMHITEDQFHLLYKAEQKSARQRAKARNFGLIYGMSAKGYKQYAWQQYGVLLTLEEAEQERLSFFRAYPKLLAYHEDMKNFVLANGYVPTVFGAKCWLPDAQSFMPKYQSAALRNSINSPIQGAAGQMTIFCIALLHHRLDPRVRLLNTVHDSIIFSIPRELLEETVRIITDTMTNPPVEQYFGLTLDVKLAVDFEASYKSWKEVLPLNEFLENEAQVNRS